MENSIKEKTKSSVKNLKKGKRPVVQNKPDMTRVKMEVPDNDGGIIWESENLKSSNKGQGPAGENL
ncbi:MAG TPA: hypothetical protein VGN20_17335 [Mucilaginibacter sp.]|jgi:hypothetical protein